MGKEKIQTKSRFSDLPFSAPSPISNPKIGLTFARYREVRLPPINLDREQIGWLTEMVQHAGGSRLPALPHVLQRIGATRSGLRVGATPSEWDENTDVETFVGGLIGSGHLPDGRRVLQGERYPRRLDTLVLAARAPEVGQAGANLAEEVLRAAAEYPGPDELATRYEQSGNGARTEELSAEPAFADGREYESLRTEQQAQRRRALGEWPKRIRKLTKAVRS